MPLAKTASGQPEAALLAYSLPKRFATGEESQVVIATAGHSVARQYSIDNYDDTPLKGV
jgi:hypothetical protein